MTAAMLALDDPRLLALGAAARTLSPLGDEALRRLAGLLQPRSFGASQWLLEGGQPALWCHFVTSGLTRELYIGEDGAEHTRAFTTAGHFTGSLLDLLSGEPSVTWVQALEPSTTLAFRWADFQALCEQHAELQRLARRVAETLYVRKARREHELLALSAASRYRQWRREHPALDGRVSQRIVASYLGITPEHLSRLRRPPSGSQRGG